MPDRTPWKDFRIASPCAADWGRMQGDDRIRHCEGCDKNVYNLTLMTPDEVTRLLRIEHGSPCVRFYRRRDGTVLTSDCPVGKAVAVRRRLQRLATVAAALVGLSCLQSALKGMGFRTDVSLVGPIATLEAWAGRVCHGLRAVEGRFRGQPPEIIMGEIAATTVTPSPAPTPAPALATPPSLEGASIPPPKTVPFNP